MAVALQFNRIDDVIVKHDLFGFITLKRLGLGDRYQASSIVLEKKRRRGENV